MPFFVLSDRIVKVLGISHSLSLTLFAFSVRYLSYGYLIKTGYVYYVLIVELTQGPTFGLFYVVMTAIAQDFSLKTQLILNEDYDDESVICPNNDCMIPDHGRTKFEQKQERNSKRNAKKDPEVRNQTTVFESGLDEKERPMREETPIRDTFSLDDRHLPVLLSLKSNQDRQEVSEKEEHEESAKEETTDVVILHEKESNAPMTVSSFSSSIDDHLSHVDAASIKQPPPSSVTAVVNTKIPDKSSAVITASTKESVKQGPTERTPEEESLECRSCCLSCRSSSLNEERIISQDEGCIVVRDCRGNCYSLGTNGPNDGSNITSIRQLSRRVSCLPVQLEEDPPEERIYATMQGIMSGVYEGAGLGVGALIAGLTIDRLGIQYTWIFAGYLSLAVCVSNLLLHVNLDNCSMRKRF